MINVVDEVLEGEPLYRAVDKDGNIILDNIRLELITPVKTAGTPLNKVLFDSIKKDDENILNLVDDLNTYIDANVSLDSLSAGKNILIYSNGLDLYKKNRIIKFTPKDATATVENLIPILSSNSQDGFVVKSEFTNQQDIGYNEKNAFDGDDTTYSYASGLTSSDFWYLVVQTPFLSKPSEITITAENVRANSLIEASQDGSKWDTLYTFSSAMSAKGTKTFSISNDVFYKYYRFSGIPYNVNNNLKVYNLQVTSAERYIFNSALKTMINDKEVVQNVDEPQIYVDGKYEAVFDGTNYILKG